MNECDDNFLYSAVVLVYFDLRLEPLLDVRLVDLEVDALDSRRAAHNFNAACRVIEAQQYSNSKSY